MNKKLYFALLLLVLLLPSVSKEAEQDEDDNVVESEFRNFIIDENGMEKTILFYQSGDDTDEDLQRMKYEIINT